MKQHEREFFISHLRLGIHRFKDIEFRSLTLQQELDSLYVYNKVYESSLDGGVMTEHEMESWLYENDMWDHDDAADLELAKKDLEASKEAIYNSRSDKRKANDFRYEIRRLEQHITELLNKKNVYYQNTCEGLASQAQLQWKLEHSLYKDNKLYDFSEHSIDFLLSEYLKGIYKETLIRDLCLEDPWKTLWNTHESAGVKLFLNTPECELTYNQKNIIVWSQLYDNIAESVDSPAENVITDHDMLDGWFIVQHKKRKREKAQEDFEKNTNSKISNSSEVFVMKNKENAHTVNDLNDTRSQQIKKERFQTIRKKGVAQGTDFMDEILDLQQQGNQQFKERFNRG